MNAPRFVVSSFCHVGGCVAVAALSGGRVAIRDDKLLGGPVLEFTAAEWQAFVAGIKNAEFDFAPLRSTHSASNRSR